jgi:glucan endo-1,3-alpha-glucosidase
VPWESDGKSNVSSAVDEVYLSSAAANDKAFIMGIAALQFKHLDGYDNWYRRGELTLAQRIPQILSLQPRLGTTAASRLT